MNHRNEDYEVGYKKPPLANRFKPGQSGNPSGKPKTAKPRLDPGAILRSIDDEEITVRVDGQRKRMTKGTIYFQQLFNATIRGDMKAGKIIADIAPRYFKTEQQESTRGVPRFILATTGLELL